MSDYFDCVIFKKTKNNKTYATKIGSAKKRDDGGFNVYLDALPHDGNFTIAPQRPRAATSQTSHDEFGDDAPF